MNFSVTQHGKQLHPSKYNWDEKTKTFSTNECDLVLDFSNLEGVTFRTGYGCNFNTGSVCNFKTGYGCNFNTGYGCNFNTGWDCNFNTGSVCNFNTGYGCNFKTGYGCNFKTGKECVVVRRDVFEVIQLVENQSIRLNEYNVKGYNVINEKKKIIIDGK